MILEISFLNVACHFYYRHATNGQVFPNNIFIILIVMSQLTFETREHEPAKNLVERNPVEEGKKLHSITQCIICSSPKTPCIMDQNKVPLVLRCINCGHMSWYCVTTRA
jgi:hypothetical protein